MSARSVSPELTIFVLPSSPWMDFVFSELASALSSPDIEERISTLRLLSERPVEARPELTRLATDAAQPLLARVWSLLAMSYIEDDSRGAFSQAAIECLKAHEPIIRRCAIDLLSKLQAVGAVSAIGMVRGRVYSG